MSGTASGINNAVARTARVLAIAILGAVALMTFANALDTRAAALELDSDTQLALRAEASRLADAAAPPGLSADQTAAVEEAIRWSFVGTFRLIAVISAVLAWLSAIIAALLVEKRQDG